MRRFRFIAAAAAATAGAAAAFLLASGTGADTGVLPVMVISENATTLTLGWTPPANIAGYEFKVDGARVSNTWDPSRSTVKFGKKPVPPHTYEVVEVIEGPAGAITNPTPPPPTTTGTTTTAPSAPSFGSATAYTQTRPAFSTRRDIPVTTASQLQTAVSQIQCGDRVHATQPFAVVGEWLINAHPSCPAVIELTGVSLTVTGTSPVPPVWINNAANLRIFGGDIHGPAQWGQAGGSGIVINGGHDLLWWDFHVHNTAHDGVDLFPTSSSIDHLDLEGEIDHWGGYPADDPHSEKGTGFHGANVADAGNGVVTNSRFAFDIHDGPTGAGIEWGYTQGNTSGDTLILRAATLTKAAQSQVAGNAIQFWGDIAPGLTIPYLEATNLQGKAIEQDAQSASMKGVTVIYGRATNTVLNPKLAGQSTWDPRNGIVYGDVR